MAILNPPTWLQAGSYNAHLDRLAYSGLINSNGACAVGDFLVTAQTTPNMTVRVGAGQAYIGASTGGANFGYYSIRNDANTNVTITAANATNPRIDLVILRVYDAAYSGATSTAQFEVIPGTASTSPVVPATPANSIALGTVYVAANATSIITSNINNAVMPIAKLKPDMQRSGASTVVTSTTLPGSSDRFVGQNTFETDTVVTRIFDGTDWVPTSGATFVGRRLTGFTLGSGVTQAISLAGADGEILGKGFTTKSVVATSGGSGTVTGPDVPVTGLYRVTANFSFGTQAGAASTSLTVRSVSSAGAVADVLGGPRVAYVDRIYNASASTLTLASVIQANKGDVIGMFIFQNSGGNWSIPAANIARFTVEYAGKA